jgi:hypothetical protein
VHVVMPSQLKVAKRFNVWWFDSNQPSH